MAQIPFSPPQTQAALQNPVRFPDQRLQQYARGQQPTGQVTPQMAQQEMATRGQERQAFQRQQAMQNNPANSPTIFQQKDMEIQQAQQALQQKEQQLGIVSALMAKQAQDLQTREQGIATLPTRPDMFTAMDGGIVFSGGGGVKGYAGPDGLSLVRGNIDDEARALDQLRVDRILGERKRKEDLERLEFLERVAPEAAEKMLRDNPNLRPSAPSTIESSAPSTTKEDKKDEGKKGPSTTGSAGQTTPSRNELEDSVTKYMGRMAPYMTTPSEVAEARSGIAGSLGRTSSAAERARPLEGKAREEMEQGERERLAKEYGEYTAGRTGRREKVAEALRGQKPELIDYLGAMAEGGPGKTLAETLSRAVPGTTKLRAEQKAREMAAAKFRAEAEELDAKADLAERRGQTAAARAFSDQADQRRAREFEITERAEKATMQGLGALATSAMEESKRNAEIAARGYGAEIDEGSRIRIAEATAKAQAKYREPNPTMALFNVLRDPKASDSDKAAAMTILGKARQPHTPSDEIKALQFADSLSIDDPRLQKYLSEDVIKGIAAGGKNLKDPKLLSAVQSARNAVARDILSRSSTAIPTAESILNLPSR
jgi:hypothetical protein